MKPEVTFLLHPFRPALIKNKQQLSAGNRWSSWFLGSQYQFLPSWRKQNACGITVFESNLVDACTFRETSQVTPQQGSDLESSVCSPLQRSTSPALPHSHQAPVSLEKHFQVVYYLTHFKNVQTVQLYGVSQKFLPCSDISKQGNSWRLLASIKLWGWH